MDGKTPSPDAEQGAEQATDRLQAIRADIDAIDSELLALLNRRARCSLEVGIIKAPTGEPVFRPVREKALMEKLLQANSGPLPEEHLRSIYREILASSRALQRPQRVAYLGPEGTFSYMAGLEFLGEALEYVPMPHFMGIFEAVADHSCQLGIVPLENSLHGTVGQSMDLFAGHEVFIQAEWYSRIRHSLLSKESSLAAIKVVYSHPQPLGQCAIWLRQHLPQARQVSLESTAAAAHKAAEEPGSAAIAHAGLASRLGLSLLMRGIEDAADNWTRFCVIGPSPAETAGADKTSVLFSVTDRPGSLTSVLRCFADAGINLLKLESRPMLGERWKYIFFADLTCDPSEPVAQRALEAAKSHCHSLRILGSYPAGAHVAG